ncbi:hypothetical protein H4R34_001988 [Dimargaris verticillata]|uniref:Mitochondrial carrier domain-containing protein n=1 Tax=Dimargaris verticillata TaxID=2761393 RepID=A0A9W8B3M1_9FUNG|nr:hypothetical protein H4R34_001988 [Dimargaris verticillata]
MTSKSSTETTKPSSSSEPSTIPVSSSSAPTVTLTELAETAPRTKESPAQRGALTILYNAISLDFIKHLAAGGVAGAVSRTVVSPLERMKIIFQVQGPGAATYHGVFPTLAKIWREEGAMGYMRGNGTNVIRIVPYSAVQFAAYEQLKTLLMESGKSELDTPRRLLAGAGAGLASVAATYPLDIVRTRLSVQSAQLASATANLPVGPDGRPVMPKLPGIWETIKTIVRTEGGVLALYAGLFATLLGVAPYVALNFQCYEVLRKYFTRPGESGPTATRKLMCGALAGSMAQTVTYPLDVLRRRMQVTSMTSMDYTYRNTWHAVTEMLRNEGVRGFYKGLIPNYLKVAPAIGVSFLTYEWCKEALNV